MNISRAVVHCIEKEVGGIANVILSKKLLPIDEQTTSVLQKLNESYGNKGVTYAIMENDVERIFPSLFAGYMEEPDNKNFLKFTKKAITSLSETLRNINTAKGGYFVFFDHEHNGTHLFSVFLLRNSAGVLFQRNEESFELTGITYLDVDKLAMACRINCDRYINDDGKYLGFIKQRQQDISDYFLNWIAAIEQESSKEYTGNLYNLLNELPCPSDENGDEIDRGEFHKKIYDYVKTQPNNVINLQTFSEHFYGDRDYLQGEAQNRGYLINTEFRPDGRTMKKFVRIDVRCNGIELRFGRDKWNSVIRVDNRTPNVVLIEDESFAAAVRRQAQESE